MLSTLLNALLGTQLPLVQTPMSDTTLPVNPRKDRQFQLKEAPDLLSPKVMHTTSLAERTGYKQHTCFLEPA